MDIKKIKIKTLLKNKKINKDPGISYKNNFQKAKKTLIISPTDTVFFALEMMIKFSTGFLLVFEKETVTGCLSERDILRKPLIQGKDIKKILVRDIMTSKVVSLTSDDLLIKSLEIFKKNSFRNLPIISTKEKLQGVITEREITNFLLLELCMEGIQDFLTSTKK